MLTDKAYRLQFARNLSAALIKKGWSQSELARRASKHFKGTRRLNGREIDVEITRNNISQYCAAKLFPGPSRLEAISKALGMKPEDLLPKGIEPRAVDPSALQITEAGEGLARVRIDREVPWSVATQIMNLISGETGGDKPNRK